MRIHASAPPIVFPQRRGTSVEKEKQGATANLAAAHPKTAAAGKGLPHHVAQRIPSAIGAESRGIDNCLRGGDAGGALQTRRQCGEDGDVGGAFRRKKREPVSVEKGGRRQPQAEPVGTAGKIYEQNLKGNAPAKGRKLRRPDVAAFLAECEGNEGEVHKEERGGRRKGKAHLSLQGEALAMKYGARTRQEDGPCGEKGGGTPCFVRGEERKGVKHRICQISADELAVGVEGEYPGDEGKEKRKGAQGFTPGAVHGAPLLDQRRRSSGKGVERTTSARRSRTASAEFASSARRIRCPQACGRSR